MKGAATTTMNQFVDDGAYGAGGTYVRSRTRSSTYVLVCMCVCLRAVCTVAHCRICTQICFLSRQEGRRRRRASCCCRCLCLYVYDATLIVDATHQLAPAVGRVRRPRPRPAYACTRRRRCRRRLFSALSVDRRHRAHARKSSKKGETRQANGWCCHAQQYLCVVCPVCVCVCVCPVCVCCVCVLCVCVICVCVLCVCFVCVCVCLCVMAELVHRLACSGAASELAGAAGMRCRTVRRIHFTTDEGGVVASPPPPPPPSPPPPPVLASAAWALAASCRSNSTNNASTCPAAVTQNTRIPTSQNQQ